MREWEIGDYVAAIFLGILIFILGGFLGAHFEQERWKSKTVEKGCAHYVPSGKRFEWKY